MNGSTPAPVTSYRVDLCQFALTLRQSGRIGSAILTFGATNDLNVLTGIWLKATKLPSHRDHSGVVR